MAHLHGIPPGPGAAGLARRCDALVLLFNQIAWQRMAGMPLLNPLLDVEAIGFAPLLPVTKAATGGPDANARAGHDDGPAQALGVLLTPWFMNLVCLPLQRQDRPAAVGQVQVLQLGGQRFEFITAHEPAIGSFGACSLYSPVLEFRDAAAARAVAEAVLALLRPTPVGAAAGRPAALPPAGARRSFLFGRRAGPGP